MVRSTRYVLVSLINEDRPVVHRGAGWAQKSGLGVEKQVGAG